jgi:hypothetical protein
MQLSQVASATRVCRARIAVHSHHIIRCMHARSPRAFIVRTGYDASLFYSWASATIISFKL